MKKVANDSSEELQQLFSQTAIKKKLDPGIIEKDFWVCWMLDYLFDQNKFKSQIEFKGGTSLSKAFNVISRFSEDIDLILDWRVLGLTDDVLWEKRSNTKQSEFIRETNKRTSEFLHDSFLPVMRSDFDILLKKEYRLSILGEDQTITFAYPRMFDEKAVLQEIRLEIGVLGAWTPASIRQITPYVAEEYPRLFSKPEASVKTVDVERTFWEKATILHGEAFREDGQTPSRYSRHYYDMYCLIKSPIINTAIQRIDLLEKVVEFKKRFYYSFRAHYDLAKVGSLRLIPPDTSWPVLRSDYSNMKNMIFGEYPSFEEILDCLSDAEKRINAL